MNSFSINKNLFLQALNTKGLSAIKMQFLFFLRRKLSVTKEGITLIGSRNGQVSIGFISTQNENAGLYVSTGSILLEAFLY